MGKLNIYRMCPKCHEYYRHKWCTTVHLRGCGTLFPFPWEAGEERYIN